jgi:adenylate cyclase
MERRLAAILAADVVGYTRLMEADESGTLAALKAHRKDIIDPKVADHKGRIVKLMGDGVLVEFPSVVEAVQCALEVQKELSARNTNVPEDRRIEFRIGVNLGDIIADDDDIYGDGVNIAARLEGLAEPGGICVSSTVFNHVNGKTDLEFEDLGNREIKNITNPVHVYRMVLDGKPRDPNTAGPRGNSFRQRWIVGVGIVAFLVVGGLVAWAVLESNQSSASKTGCTDHLGLPVPAEECPKN